MTNFHLLYSTIRRAFAGADGEMKAFATGLSSAVHGASASMDAFARHRKLDAACTDEDKVTPGERVG